MKQNKSNNIFFALILINALLAVATIYLPASNTLPIPAQDLPAPKIVIATASFLAVLLIYGGLGFAGLKLSQKLGFPKLWDKRISNKEKFIIPAITGVVIGIFFILIDFLINELTPYGRLPHPDFPLSIIASLSAGIGEEVIFRLFFISFWSWLISHIILKGKASSLVFWLVSVWSALTFSLGHLPSIMAIEGLNSISQIPPLIVVEIIVLNSTLSIPAAYYFKKYGILSAMGVHFWTDIVWHAIYGLT